jgi:hypothetical protein
MITPSAHKSALARYVPGVEMVWRPGAYRSARAAHGERN